MSDEQPIKFWPKRTSYSALTTFEECPLAYKLAYYDKIETPSGPAASMGTRLHLACERYLKGEIPLEHLPFQFASIKHLLLDFKGMGAKAEAVWLVTDDWEYREEDGPDCKMKAIVDIHYIHNNWLYVWDLKSGKAYDSHADQLLVYAALGLAKYPDVAGATAAPLYLEGPGAPRKYPRDLAASIQRYVRDRWVKLFSNEQWEKAEGPDSCKWCEYPRMGHCDSVWSRKK